MAAFLEESQQYISRLIKNKIIPRLNKLKKFSEKTDTPLEFWLTSSGPEKEHAIKSVMIKKVTFFYPTMTPNGEQIYLTVRNMNQDLPGSFLWHQDPSLQWIKDIQIAAFMLIGQQKVCVL